jgi:hypothetical protein
MLFLLVYRQNNNNNNKKKQTKKQKDLTNIQFQLIREDNLFIYIHVAGTLRISWLKMRWLVLNSLNIPVLKSQERSLFLS